MTLIPSLFVIFLGIVVDETSGVAEDLVNTKNITTDLKWTAFPREDGWEEVTGYDDISRRAIRYYQVCNRRNPDADNWVRTQFIESKGAKRAYIDVEFSMMKCEDEETKNCRETFNLYYYESNTDRATSTFPPWRERPYVKIDTIAAGKRFSHGDQQGGGINRKTWTLGPLKKRGFYIAAHDKGSCMSLLSLRVYYFYCPSAVVELANFKRTVAGEEVASLVTVHGKCVDYADEVSFEDPRYHCNSNGEWRVRTGTCQCIPGYQANDNMTSCEACSIGKYKLGHGNHRCTECPENSASSGTGALSLPTDNGASYTRVEKPTGAPAFCKCLAGYFRAPSEDVHQPCTRTPSKPTKVKLIANETSVSLAWNEPADLGERVDTFYNVTCAKCRTESYVSCSHCDSSVTFEPSDRRKITSREVDVRNLDPYTHYQFKVFALNGVSSVSHTIPSYEVVQTRTKEAAPSKVESVRTVESSPHSITLAWSLPRRPNGFVLGYEIAVREMNNKEEEKGDLSAIDVESEDLISYATENRSMSIQFLKPNQKYAVKVRAKTAAGFGQYSDPYLATTKEPDVPPTTSAYDSGQLGLIIGVGAVAVVLLTGAFVAAYFIYDKKKVNEAERFGDSFEAKDSFEDARQLVVHLPVTNSSHRLYFEYPDPQQAVREFSTEIDPTLLEIEETIGQGEFGEVYRGKLKETLDSDSEFHEVAIKRLKNGASVKDRLNFLREASNMSQFDHPNVLILKGVVTKSRPMMIVSEYMENGALNHFLKANQGELSVLQLSSMLHGIASGMHYLCNIQYIHRDLAARNILVNSDLVCKVSDFGLSRTLENDPHATYTTQGGKIALRWTAPESIRYRQFTSASDVWSFGIVMWEVMSYGEKPYWNMTNTDVFDSIEEGFRLPPPHDCPIVLHKMMIECWLMEPKQRPTFEQLVQKFELFIQDPDLFKDRTPTMSTSESKSTEEMSSCEE